MIDVPRQEALCGRVAGKEKALEIADVSKQAVRSLGWEYVPFAYIFV